MRGALNISVKLEFVDNENKFREISAGVKFFSSKSHTVHITQKQESSFRSLDQSARFSQSTK